MVRTKASELESKAESPISAIINAFCFRCSGVFVHYDYFMRSSFISTFVIHFPLRISKLCLECACECVCCCYCCFCFCSVCLLYSKCLSCFRLAFTHFVWKINHRRQCEWSFVFFPFFFFARHFTVSDCIPWYGASANGEYSKWFLMGRFFFQFASYR